VIKTNHDQGGVFICQDRTSFDWTAARREIRRRMSKNFYYKLRERQYRDIKPMAFAEALLVPQGPEGLVDYKVNCFNGKPEIIQVNMGGRRAGQVQLFYDVAWTKLPVWRTYPDITRDARRPAMLESMLACAAALSAPFPFCRVDFYEVDNRILVGEITFHPGGGIKRFEPPEWERRIGAMLALPVDAASPR
jgi:hypothetical protein